MVSIILSKIQNLKGVSWQCGNVVANATERRLKIVHEVQYGVRMQKEAGTEVAYKIDEIKIICNNDYLFNY